ncbi:MAG: hypothetical protein ACK5V3_06755, partial [Bdellovibrionales bacterium]
RITAREVDAADYGADIYFSTQNGGVSETPLADRMVIRTDGNVGIGTTAPDRLLHVNGPMRLTASALPSTPSAGDIAVDSGDSNKLKFYNGSTWQSAGGSGSGLPATGGTAAAPGYAFVGDTDTGVFSSVADTVQFSTNASERMRIDSMGNVGIGTTNPAYTLDVAGNAASTRLSRNLRLTNVGLYGNGDGIIADDGSGSTIFSIRRMGVSGNDAQIQALDGISFFTNGFPGTERMRILANGNVGIGTTNPGGGKLNITRDSSVSGDTNLILDNNEFGAFKWTGISFRTLGTERGSILVGQDGAAASYMALKTNGIDRIYADGSGNVGIGTNTPDKKLTVFGEQNILSTTGTEIFHLADVGGYGVLNVKDNTGSSRISLNSYGSNGPRVSMESTTNTPDGATQSFGANVWVGIPHMTGHQNGIFFSSGGNIASAAITTLNENNFSYGNGSLLFKTTNSGTVETRMKITNTGNVGIGTTTPQATLDVNGYMRLAKNATPPAACGATNDGAIALTSQYTVCVCKGGTSTWVSTTNGTTACSWSSVP